MKFIIDNNVGKLARALRLLGYDAVFINPIEDALLIDIACREGRVILTKDRGILRRRVVTSGEVKALYVEGDDWRRQLTYVVDRLVLDRLPRFNRCLECNALLETRTRDQARPHVPSYVHRTQTTFFGCPSCGRYYWNGTHRQRMQLEVQQIFGGRPKDRVPPSGKR